jgi:hypothetical protein
VDIGFSRDAAVNAVTEALSKNLDEVSLLMIAESEGRAKEQEHDRVIMECLEGR